MSQADVDHQPSQSRRRPDPAESSWLAALARLASITCGPSHAWMWFGYYPIQVLHDSPRDHTSAADTTAPERRAPHRQSRRLA